MSTTNSITIANTSLVLDFSYKGDDLVKRVSEIIGLSNSGWDIVDSKDNLVLIHYKDDANMDEVGHLRGILVDTEAGAVIAGSFGYTPVAVSSKLTTTDGQLTIKDQDNVVHTFDPAKVVIKRVFEGVVIRCIWHKGELYRITHKKISPLRSRWGSSKKFLELYEEAGGPTADQLFDTSKPFSSTCYDFLVVDNSLLVGTRQRVNKPYLVLLAERTMELNRPSNQVAPGKRGFVTSSKISGTVDESFIHEPKSLSLDEANTHLTSGFFNPFESNDERQTTGEAVIVYETNDNGDIRDIVKVHSIAYDWRTTMRGDNPNLINRFYTMLNMVYMNNFDDAKWKQLCKNLIIFPIYSTSSIRELFATNKQLLYIPEIGSIMDYSNRDDRIYLLWLNYVLSLPPSHQSVALDILDNFHTDRTELIRWMQGIQFSTIEVELTEKITRLLERARKFAHETVRDGKNYNQSGKRLSLNAVISNNIRNLINKEDGANLYALVREMKKIKADQAKLQETKVDDASKLTASN